MAEYVERLEYKLEILPNRTIQVREATITEKDGVEVGRQYHREVYVPGSDVTAAPQVVADTAGALWSADVVTAYEASLEDDE